MKFKKTAICLCFVFAANAALCVADDPSGFTGGGGKATGSGYRIEGAVQGYGLANAAGGAAQNGAVRLECGDFFVRQTRLPTNASDPVWDLYAQIYSAPAILRPEGIRLALTSPENEPCLP